MPRASWPSRLAPRDAASASGSLPADVHVSRGETPSTALLPLGANALCLEVAQPGLVAAWSQLSKRQLRLDAGQPGAHCKPMTSAYWRHAARAVFLRGNTWQQVRSTIVRHERHWARFRPAQAAPGFETLCRPAWGLQAAAKPACGPKCPVIQWLDGVWHVGDTSSRSTSLGVQPAKNPQKSLPDLQKPPILCIKSYLIITIIR